MRNNYSSAGSPSVSLKQLIALFKSTQPSEGITKLFLYTIGAVLTPITLVGAIIGYKRAYERFGLPKGKSPYLTDISPIMWTAMFLGAVTVWAFVIVLLVIATRVMGSFIGDGLGTKAMMIFITINVVISSIIFRFFTRWQRAMSGHIAERGRYGSARFAGIEEIKDLERKPGIYISGGIYAYEKQGHLLTLGGTRGGKGVNLIVPNLLGLSGYEGSWFIIDVKGELAAISARFQRQKGQNVVILDPWSVNSANGATYNPLDLLEGQTNPDDLIDDISIIAEMIVPKETQGDQFWNNKARSLIGGLILHLVTTLEKKSQTLGKVWEWLRLPVEQLEDLFSDMAISDSAVVRATANEYVSIMHTTAKMFQSIIAAAQEKTDFLKSPALQKSLASSNFDVKNITNGKTTLYVIIPPDKLDSHFQWLRLVMTTALRSAVRNRDKKITFLLDEFAALGYLPEVKTALSTYAGYDITMWPIVQDLGQLQTLYGQSWETFISNTAIRQFLSVSDVFSLEYLSKLMGTTTIVTYDESGKPQTTSRPLVTPDEIRRASADNVFVLIEQRPVLTFPKIPYYEMPTLAGKYDENPYYKK